jgi:hypothetical protein
MRLFVSLAALLALNTAARLAHADDPCTAFTWDVRHERALFGRQAQSLAAGQTLAASPTIAIDRLYQLQLRAQAEVSFPAAPGKGSRSDGAYAGVVRLTVNATGLYRISLDQPVWVDVIENGTMIPANDFQGRRGCDAPHKIVQFLLSAGSPIALQFSASNVPVVKVAVTPSPIETS